MKVTFAAIATYFFRGLLITVPLAGTIYIVISFFEWMDSLLPFRTLGVGIIVILISITFIGYLTSLFVARSLFEWFERLLLRLPMVGLIYTSIKDLMAAFVGEEKKFSKSVLVKINAENDIYRLGFITAEDLSLLKINDLIGVYFPHSYNISGNLYLVAAKNITPIDYDNSADLMKFIASGGVSELLPNTKKNKDFGEDLL
ncbi:hypothetical protein Fleli_3705 [Bernardetia litoralis DSM 6794]|uniref:DUF502 domain-containing protein n=1 Tax=Bernardetia litoralis (strain ATCC 23117 / DSM 6794 / NBRC 15988 / NCIMB 1366 / Fx l1 / Sio-4) TaxID=880071 RepID=I4APY2_BERLS|nr:DUF502 domain-containing protein [Bernardetia litoralis]AFM06017.1 hypothetical protein Fleli_3705 [Bernardetia litoralis DSM 6794]